MKKFLFNSVGRLRVLGFLEGISLLLLVGIAVPLKYIFDAPEMARVVGSVHGALFLLFILGTLSVGVERNWSFKRTTWKVLLACIIPFGTFYIDYTILRHLQEKNPSQG